MVSNLQFLIVDAMNGDDIPSAPPRKNTKSEIGSAEAMKSTDIDDAETLAAGASDAAKTDRVHVGYVPQDIKQKTWQTCQVGLKSDQN